MNRNDKLRFGKYKGSTIQEVLACNPSYLVWAYNTIDFFFLDKKILAEAKRLKKQEEAFRAISYTTTRTGRRRFYADFGGIDNADYDYDGYNPMGDYARDVAYGFDY